MARAAGSMPVAGEGSAMDGAGEWRIDVWQFVRVMVALEAMPGTTARRAWGGIWREIDDRLARLGESDAAGFAALMMDEEVVLPVADRRVLADAAQALDRVDRELSAALAEPGVAEERRVDLAFERRALRRLRRHLPEAEPPRPRRGARSGPRGV